MLENKRISWVDISKGIAIMLTIAGHSIGSAAIRGAIFSFHMPFFFILSGFTSHYSKNMNEWWKKTKKSFRRLVISGVVLYIIRFWLSDFRNNILSNSIRVYSLSYILGKFKNMILSIIWASGVKVVIGDLTVQAMGVPWFLIVLFSAKTLLDLLQLKLDNKKLGIVVTILSVTGVVISKVIWLPFSLDITLAVLGYIYIGKICKNINLTEKKAVVFWISSVIWAGTLLVEYCLTHSYAELACRRYTMFPLCALTALAGTVALVCFSMYIDKERFVGKNLEFIGYNSMSLLCIHIMDGIWNLWLVKILVNQYLVCGVRIIIDVGLLYLFCISRNKIQKTIKINNTH